jgi:hypothetical protein
VEAPGREGAGDKTRAIRVESIAIHMKKVRLAIPTVATLVLGSSERLDRVTLQVNHACVRTSNLAISMLTSSTFPLKSWTARFRRWLAWQVLRGRTFNRVG